jgi:uncharacterized linocin/CFP29 family protein
MDDRNAQVGWTEAQWNRVREEILQAWQRVRVAGSFLPIYGPLPPSTQVVPSEVLKPDGSVDDEATASLLEIALPVTLSRQQIWEEDLSSALLQFRRRATQLGQLEDWYIFNGTYPSTVLLPNARVAFAQGQKAGLPGFRPALPYLEHLTPNEWALISGTPMEGAKQGLQIEDMRQQNPGVLGLIEAPWVERQAGQVPLDQRAQQRAQQASPLDNQGLMNAIVDAINSLEENGYVAPYVCVLGRNPFRAAFTPINNSAVLPRDRIEPLIGRELLHASSIDILPQSFGGYGPKLEPPLWQSRGVLLSMADEPIDLALAAEATPEFRQVNLDGRYVFSVFERFALRIKDAKAIVPLQFQGP